MIRNIAKGEGYRNLEEETNRSQCITCKGSKAEAADDRWRVGVKGTLRAIVGECNEEVDP
jgi:hypothetical protein